MKKNNLYLFSSVCAIVMLCSCMNSSNPSKLFIHKWQVTDFRSKFYDDHMAMAEKELATATDSNEKMLIRQKIDAGKAEAEGIKKMTLDCKADSSCIISQVMMNQQMSTKAKWSIIDGKTLVMKREGSAKPDTVIIDTITSEKMVLTAPDGNGGTAVITYKPVQ
jgi:hypothetical protein